MIKIPPHRLDELKNNFSGKKIAVIGDMMLDCYFWGEVKRISPEAPVPIVEIGDEFYRLGGAANVALNILTLGGIPFPIGVIGEDNDGKIFMSLIEQHKLQADGIIIDKSRPTTAKTRVIAHSQHVVRIDKESKDYINEELHKKIFSYVESHIKKIDGIILEDYNKGVLTPELIERVIDLANKNDMLITVDPKFNNFFAYKHVTVFKPNRKEAEEVLGIKIKTSSDVSAAGKIISERLSVKNVLLTLGEEGIAVFSENQPEKRMPTKAIKVADVSGAGDTVISTLTMALAANANILEASYLANFAAGIVCGEVGIVPIEKDNLFSVVKDDHK